MYLHELVAEVGREVVMQMQRELGKGYISIPEIARPDHPFARYMDIDTLQRICTAHGPGRIWIGSTILVSERNAEILRRRQMGESTDDLAQEYGLTARHIRAMCQGVTPVYYGLWARRFLAQRQAPEDQLDLFEDEREAG